ncbi:hypothetical protein D9758_013490 [Tetrapyrgos nigripes]|uniref:Uncharacterized protein n=1 Tax=Tetrapyrgos nigripes TaxID=182062 RepID=A0A8H5FR60_9AGAR|nr:hypothetical protein D9758_013490 [Tetrapyrgos nigripes]
MSMQALKDYEVVMFEMGRMLVEGLRKGATGSDKEDRDKETGVKWINYLTETLANPFRILSFSTSDRKQPAKSLRVSPSNRCLPSSSSSLPTPIRVQSAYTVHSEHPTPSATLPHMPSFGSPTASSAYRKEEDR